MQLHSQSQVQFAISTTSAIAIAMSAPVIRGNRRITALDRRLVRLNGVILFNRKSFRFGPLLNGLGLVLLASLRLLLAVLKPYFGFCARTTICPSRMSSRSRCATSPRRIPLSVATSTISRSRSFLHAASSFLMSFSDTCRCQCRPCSPCGASVSRPWRRVTMGFFSARFRARYQLRRYFRAFFNQILRLV
jgi:hypothetical protein